MTCVEDNKEDPVVKTTKNLKMTKAPRDKEDDLLTVKLVESRRNYLWLLEGACGVGKMLLL